jgi:hypothetical protein
MIGGDHYITPPHSVANSMRDMLEGCLGNVSYFASGRDALYSLLNSIPHRVVHLPDLICFSVYQACIQAEKEAIAYQVHSDFVHIEAFQLGKISVSCLLVMHYFGVANMELMQRAKVLGVTVISDVTHLLFDGEQVKTISDNSDYVVASLRKSGPFPDGGFLSSRHHPVPKPTRGIREDFFALRSAALLSRGFSARNDFEDEENLHLLRKAENLIDSSMAGDYQCSYYSMELLRTINLDGNALQIAKNTVTLSMRLSGRCGTVNTQLGHSPYFLCRFESQEERDTVRQLLADFQYFCPIHWDTSQMPSPSPLSKTILSIPCDARYNESDMEAVAEVINSCRIN